MKTCTNKLLLLIFLMIFVGLQPKAHASSFSDVLTNGSYEGAVGIHILSQDSDGTDQSFGNGFLMLSGESGEGHGLKFGAGFTGLAKLWEDHDDDAEGVDGGLINLAYINYERNRFSLTAGRQELDLEWIGDFHEAISVGYSGLDKMTITALATRSLAVADPDGISDEFEELLDKDGGHSTGYAFDLKYQALVNLELNGYVFGIEDLFKGYGLKLDYGSEQLGATVHYALSDEDTNGSEGGDILHGELRGACAGLLLSGGYIKTDDDAGAGSLASMGDNISPFEDGNYAYDVDAQSWYAGAEYEFGKMAVAALFGETEYGDSSESELNVIVNYDFLENVNAEFLLVNVDAEHSSDDYTRGQFMVTLTF